MDEAALGRSLLRWYERARRDLPWRKVRDPYAVWVSETMLQQTRVSTVVPYYERFLRELPTVQSLAEAPEERVLALWSGLGYYRRARMLQKAAQRVAASFGGELPRDAAALRELEGVGAYTAGAIASIAFGQRAALVDGNVARVLARVFAVEEDVESGRGKRHLWELAERLVAVVEGDPGDWNQALMELGATQCAPREPECPSCPLREQCLAHARGLTRELPRTPRKRPPRDVRRATIVLASPQAVLLARRRKDTLWGGLWEPPSAEGELAPLAANLKIDVDELRLAGRVIHVLTHRRVHVEVAQGALSRRKRWPLPDADYDAIEVVAWQKLPLYAHSTLARKVLVMANVPARGLSWKK